jgi:hypothetical protein
MFFDDVRNYLFAIGLEDGEIAVYDIGKPGMVVAECFFRGVSGEICQANCQAHASGKLKRNCFFEESW